MENLPVYINHMEHDAAIFLSGFYEKDFKIIDKKCTDIGLKYVKHHLKNDWVCAKYVKV